MQKKLIVLALAGLTAAPAFAQSNVTVYGRVDYGYMSRSGGDGGYDSDGRKGEMASGMQAGSRLGFKGSEDLGNGLKAIFELESGVTNDAAAVAGTFSALNRHAYVGVTGNFGTVVGGRLDGVRYGVYNKYDAFAGGGMGNFTQMTMQVDRADNAIAYISPKFSGFGLTLAHATRVAGQEQAGTQTLNNTNANGTNGNASDGKLYTIMGTYDNGPLSLTLDYETVRYVDSNNTGGGALDNQVVTTVGGSYDFKFVKLSALYDRHRAESSNNWASRGDLVDYNAWFVSASAPYGNFLFKATYGRVSDQRNSKEQSAASALFTQGDASKFGIGVNYLLSKRTNVYFDYARISNNDRNSNYTLTPAANGQGGAATTALGGSGYGVSGFNIGLAHNF
jgi:predicted porin